MSQLDLSPMIDSADDFYAALVESHEGLSKAESDAFNARLILILANQIGDRDILQQALLAAGFRLGAPTEP